MASSLCSSRTGGNVLPPRPPHGTPSARNPARSKPPLDEDLRHERMLSPRPRHPRPTWCGPKPAGQLASFGSEARWDAGPPSRSLGSPPAGNGEKQLVALTGPWGGRRDRTREAAGAQCPRGPRDAEWGRGAHAARAPAPGESVSIPAFSGTHGDRGQSHSGAPLSHPQHPPGAAGKTGMKPMRSAPSARNEIRTQDQR